MGVVAGPTFHGPVAVGRGRLDAGMGLGVLGFLGHRIPVSPGEMAELAQVVGVGIVDRRGPGRPGFPCGRGLVAVGGARYVVRNVVRRIEGKGVACG